MRENALELKLCKIPTIGTQSENQTLPTGNISLGSPIVFSDWALHDISTHFMKACKNFWFYFNGILVIKFKKYL
ncbi:hypothetical protein BB407_05690 [Helicobacter pylori]|nr:hypothetical protein B0X36_06930 [Helicobacter pylori]PDX09919.1 hypothetical protein BB407_05690 [Helicobacter pylori]